MCAKKLVAAIVVCLGPDIVGCQGPAGPAGPQGPQGPAGSTSPTVGLIIPHTGYLDRTLTVIVSGEGLAFDKNAPTFDFGSDLTTSNITVIDADSAVVTVTIAVTAAIGPRDVKVTAGATTATATGGFDVEPPLTIQPTQFMGANLGTPQQGGVAVFNIHNNDADNEVASNFLYLTKSSELWSTDVLGSDNGTDLVEAVVFDPLAPTGPLQIELANQSLDGTPTVTFLANPAAVTVAARSPTTLPPGVTGVNGSIQQFGGSSLYEVTTTTPSVVSINAYASDANQVIAPRIRVYGADGLSDQLIDDEGGSSLFGTLPATSTFPLAMAGKLYVIVADSGFGGGTGYGFTISAAPTSVAAADVIASPATAHDTPATAIAEAACNPGPCIITGTIASAMQIDAYSLVLTAANTVNLSVLRDPGTAIGASVTNAVGTNFNYCSGCGCEFYNATVNPLSPANAGSSTTVPGTAGIWYVVVGDFAASQQSGKYAISITVQ
jgi:hypothetical protein